MVTKLHSQGIPHLRVSYSSSRYPPSNFAQHAYTDSSDHASIICGQRSIHQTEASDRFPPMSWQLAQQKAAWMAFCWSAMSSLSRNSWTIDSRLWLLCFAAKICWHTSTCVVSAAWTLGSTTVNVKNQCRQLWDYKPLGHKTRFPLA